MKVFVSSLISGMTAERAAVKRVIELLRHSPVMAEDFGSQPNSPQIACLQGVRSADLVVLILGDRYGERQASGLSATHEEYRAARGEIPVLMFLHGGSPEPDQAAFIKEVSGWEGGLFRKPFTSPEELAEQLTRDLHSFELAHVQGPVDADGLARRAMELLPQPSHNYQEHAQLQVALSVGPQVTILRPAAMDDTALTTQLQKQAVFGDPSILDLGEGTHARLDEHTLVVYQGERHQHRSEVHICSNCDMRLLLPIKTPDSRASHFPFLIEEDLTAQLTAALRYLNWALTHIDPTERLTHVALAARISGQGVFGWQTRAQAAVVQNGISIGMGDPRERSQPVQLTPAHMRRQALAMSVASTVSDLVALLRRRWRDPRG